MGQNLTSVTAVKINDFGRHLWALPKPKENTETFLKILYVYIIFYYTAVVAIKLCMLVNSFQGKERQVN